MLIDSTGVGDPICEQVQLTKDEVEGLKFTPESKQKLILGLVTAVQQKLIGFPEGVITAEMELFEYIYTSRGVKYSAPDGLHDDAVIALALARKCFVEKATAGQYHLM
jgi:hypothetical protein